MPSITKVRVFVLSHRIVKSVDVLGLKMFVEYHILVRTYVEY